MIFLLSELTGMGILAGLFLLVTFFVESAARSELLCPESSRKSIHVLGGLGCLLFPILVESWVSVLIMSIIFGIFFYAGERFQLLKSLSSVKRKSLGSLLFPIAILFLFITAQKQMWLYASSLLVLVLADTAAALAGTQFGKVTYATCETQKKSLEGSLSFALIAYAAVFSSMVFLSDFPVITCALTTLLMVIILMGIEGVSIGGTDNIFVPLITVFMLMKTPTKPQEEILFQCASLIGIAILVVIMNAHRHNLRIRHIIIYVIAAYTSWSLGGLDWAIPFIVGFVAYDLLCKNCTPVIDSISSRRIVRPFIPIMILVFIANLTENFSFLFGPFLVAGFFTTSACIVNRFRDTQHKTITEFKCTCITAIISLLLCIPTQGFYTVICLSPVIVATSVLLSIVYKKLPYNPEHTGLQRYKIPLISASGAGIYCLLQLAGLPLMQPLTWMEVFR